MSASLRPAAAYLVHAIGVTVTPRVAAWLLTHTDLQRVRAAVRGTDPEVDAVLIALSSLGHQWRTSAASVTTGSALGGEQSQTAALEWMTTRQAAERLALGERAIRLACSEGRLPARRSGGRWQIQRSDLENYCRDRAA